MRTSLVLTVLGPDRTGLVEAVANVIAEHNANWLESSMARLAGKFAGVLRVDAPDDQIDKLTKALNQLRDQGLTIILESTPGSETPGSEAPAPATPDTRTLNLTFIGHDRPGIVRDISRALAQHHVNVIEFNSRVESAPMTGEPLFKAAATLHAPHNTSLDTLRDQLDQIANHLNLDLHLED